MASFLEEDLAVAIGDGNFYEAHQLYLSISQRLYKQKKFKACLEKLIEGIKTLTEAGQMKSATDLSNKFIQYLTPPADPISTTVSVSSSTSSPSSTNGLVYEWNDDLRDYCVQIVKCLQLPQSSAKNIVSKSLELSKKLNKKDSIPSEDKILHYQYGLLFIQIHDYYSGIHHLILGDNNESYSEIAKVIDNLFGLVYTESNFTNSDNIQLLVFTIISMLKIKKHQAAYDLLVTLINRLSDQKSDLILKTIYFKSKYQSHDIEMPVFILRQSFTVFNFLQLLIFTVAKNCKSHFGKLKLQYKNNLSSKNQTLLDELEGAYFSLSTSSGTLNISSPNSAAHHVAGMINNVFRGIFTNFSPMTRAQSSSSTAANSTSTDTANVNQSSTTSNRVTSMERPDKNDTVSQPSSHSSHHSGISYPSDSHETPDLD